jgi:hypothetical protein
MFFQNLKKDDGREDYVCNFRFQYEVMKFIVRYLRCWVETSQKYVKVLCKYF